MKLVLLIALFALTAHAADPATNNLHRIPPRHLRQVAMPPVPTPDLQLGLRHSVGLYNGISVEIVSTNHFTKQQARQWLQEAIRTLK